MREFKTNNSDFSRRTRRRVVVEIFFLLAISAFFLSSLSGVIPEWLKISVISISVLYIVVGLASYPKDKSFAEKFTIYLSNDSLGFSDDGKIRKLPYSDLAISKVLRKHDEVVEIRLRTTFGQTIKLRGLDSMQELYSELVQKVEGA